MEQTPIQRAIAISGSQQALGRMLKVSQSAVGQWALDGRPVPLDRAVEIEQVLEAQITCNELRPDARWVRIPDPSWPHPGGRPLLDVATPVAQEAAA